MENLGLKSVQLAPSIEISFSYLFDFVREMIGLYSG